MAWTQAQLDALRTARQDLLTGYRVVEVEHASGKRVRYQQGDLGAINDAIAEAEHELGVRTVRRTTYVMTGKGL